MCVCGVCVINILTCRSTPWPLTLHACSEKQMPHLEWLNSFSRFNYTYVLRKKRENCFHRCHYRGRAKTNALLGKCTVSILLVHSHCVHASSCFSVWPIAKCQVVQRGALLLEVIKSISAPGQTVKTINGGSVRKSKIKDRFTQDWHKFDFSEAFLSLLWIFPWSMWKKQKSDADSSVISKGVRNWFYSKCDRGRQTVDYSAAAAFTGTVPLPHPSFRLWVRLY